MEALIRAGAFSGFRELSDASGLDYFKVLDLAGLQHAQLQNPDNLVAASTFADALSLSAMLSEQFDFGVRLAGVQAVDILGPAGALASQAGSVREGFDIISKYLCLHHPDSILRVEHCGSRTLIIYEDMIRGTSMNPQISDLAMGLIVRTIRQWTDKDWLPHGVFFAHYQPDDIASYEKLFQAPLFFDHEAYSVEVESVIMDQPINHACAELRAGLYAQVEALAVKQRFSQRHAVERLIRVLLPMGDCTEEQVAAALGMHRRTLQRRLGAEGLYFRNILARVRDGNAKQYLLTSNMRLTRIAAALGYSELSAFTRFFKAKTGLTPKEYRARNRESGVLSRESLSLSEDELRQLEARRE